MIKTAFQEVFSPIFLKRLFPEERTDAFFEALFGDPNEGAYNIRLAFIKKTKKHLHFEFQLTPRPEKCLACHLTYGLPRLFSQHPIIDVNGIVNDICKQLTDGTRCDRWALGQTEERSSHLHVIPLIITVTSKGAGT